MGYNNYGKNGNGNKQNNTGKQNNANGYNKMKMGGKAQFKSHVAPLSQPVNGKNKPTNQTTKPWAPRPVKQKDGSQRNNGPYRGVTGTGPKMGGKSNFKNGAKTNSKKSFMDGLQDEFYKKANVAYTENGARGYKSSGSALVDLNFAVTQLRSKTGDKANDAKIIDKFRAAYQENPELAVVWLIYARSIRDKIGLGERNIFRVCMIDLAKNNMDSFVKKVIPKFGELGRYDDLWPLLNIKATRNAVCGYVVAQLGKDIEDYKQGKNISLLAKWMPSCNTSSKQTVKYSMTLQKALKWTPRQYRQTLATLRKHIDVTEVKMSDNQWQAIDYEKVPSKANLLYSKAFLKHDEDRRRKYLGALNKGDAKINASVVYPHEIVHAYNFPKYSCRNVIVDPALEAMWKTFSSENSFNLKNIIVVADGSGSMTTKIRGTDISCLEVANALSIYCSEHCEGAYKDKYITFSTQPQLVDLSDCKTLRDKVVEARKYDEVSNTNIELTFDLLLNVAVDYGMSQDEIPDVLVLSDLGFDYATGDNRGKAPDQSLFNTIRDKWNDAGYELPKIVWWNIASMQSNALPVSNNENFPCALVSGFSVNVLKMVMSKKLNPYDVLVETLENPVYDWVRKAYKDSLIPKTERPGYARTQSSNYQTNGRGARSYVTGQGKRTGYRK